MGVSAGISSITHHPEPRTITSLQWELTPAPKVHSNSLSVSGVYKVTATVTAYSIQTPGASTGPPGPITPPQFKHANIFELHQSLYIHIKHITLSSNHSMGFSGLSKPLIVSKPSITLACLMCNFFPSLFVNASAGFHSPGCHCILKNLDLKQSRI